MITLWLSFEMNPGIMKLGEFTLSRYLHILHYGKYIG